MVKELSKCNKGIYSLLYAILEAQEIKNNEKKKGMGPMNDFKKPRKCI